MQSVFWFEVECPPDTGPVSQKPPEQLFWFCAHAVHLRVDYVHIGSVPLHWKNFKNALKIFQSLAHPVQGCQENPHQIAKNGSKFISYQAVWKWPHEPRHSLHWNPAHPIPPHHPRCVPLQWVLGRYLTAIPSYLATLCSQLTRLIWEKLNNWMWENVKITGNWTMPKVDKAPIQCPFQNRLDTFKVLENIALGQSLEIANFRRSQCFSNFKYRTCLSFASMLVASSSCICVQSRPDSCASNNCANPHFAAHCFHCHWRCLRMLMSRWQCNRVLATFGAKF